jgi:hypothetical protein
MNNLNVRMNESHLRLRAKTMYSATTVIDLSLVLASWMHTRCLTPVYALRFSIACFYRLWALSLCTNTIALFAVHF